MKNQKFRRIITSFWAIVISISLCLTPVLAAWQNEVGHWYVNAEYAQWAVGVSLDIVGSVGGTVLAGPVGATCGGIVAELVDKGILSLAEALAAGYTDDDYYAAENEYLTSVETEYGTTVFGHCDGYPYKIEASGAAEPMSLSGLGLEVNFTSSGYMIYNAYFTVSKSGQYTVNMPGVTCSCGVSHLSSAYRSVYFYQIDDSGTATYLNRWWGFGESDVTYSVGLVAGTIYRLDYSLIDMASGYHNVLFNFPMYLSGSLILDAPESSTRPSSLMSAINNYNVDNSYTDNSTTVNYFLAPSGETPTADNVVSPAIYDEETLVFTEPATGVQYQTTGWTYDYTTRTYDITLSAGTYTIDETDVTRIVSTYGDELATITYYDSSGTVLATDEYDYVMMAGSACAIDGHSYTVEETKTATCTSAGERKYTCSVCSDEYTEDVPATGHTWEVSEVVDPEVDEDGNILTAGYTVYICSSCGADKTSYDDSDSGSDSSGSGGSGSGIWASLAEKISSVIGSLVEAALDLVSTVLKSVLSLVTDLLSFFFDLLSDGVTLGLSNFFDSFSDSSITDFFQRENEDGSTTTALPDEVADGLSFIPSVFSGLPAELRGVLTFGIALMFLLAAFKLIL